MRRARVTCKKESWFSPLRHPCDGDAQRGAAPQTRGAVRGRHEIRCVARAHQPQETPRCAVPQIAPGRSLVCQGPLTKKCQFKDEVGHVACSAAPPGRASGAAAPARSPARDTDVHVHPFDGLLVLCQDLRGRVGPAAAWGAIAPWPGHAPWHAPRSKFTCHRRIPLDRQLVVEDMADALDVNRFRASARAQWPRVRRPQGPLCLTTVGAACSRADRQQHEVVHRFRQDVRGDPSARTACLLHRPRAVRFLTRRACLRTHAQEKKQWIHDIKQALADVRTEPHPRTRAFRCISQPRRARPAGSLCVICAPCVAVPMRAQRAERPGLACRPRRWDLDARRRLRSVARQKQRRAEVLRCCAPLSPLWAPRRRRRAGR
jgi:hypothetical protein